MELHFLALMVVGVCLPVHVVTGAQDSSCYYEDAGEWSVCYPRTKQQTMAQFLVDGEDTCAQTKTKTRPCKPKPVTEEETDEESKDETEDSSCEYENTGEWSACYPRTKQQTMAQSLVDGEDICPQTKTKTRSCTPETSEESDDEYEEEGGLEDEEEGGLEDEGEGGLEGEGDDGREDEEADPGQFRRSRGRYLKDISVRIESPGNSGFGGRHHHTGTEGGQHQRMRGGLSDFLNKILAGEGNRNGQTGYGRFGHQTRGSQHQHNSFRGMRSQPVQTHHGFGHNHENRRVYIQRYAGHFGHRGSMHFGK